MLLAVFTAAVAAVLMRGIDIECGCFGTGSGPVSWLTLLRNLGLLGAAVLLVIADRPVAPSAHRA
jgi:hypothetical protein